MLYFIRILFRNLCGLWRLLSTRTTEFREHQVVVTLNPLHLSGYGVKVKALLLLLMVVGVSFVAYEIHVQNQQEALQQEGYTSKLGQFKGHSYYWVLLYDTKNVQGFDYYQILDWNYTFQHEVATSLWFHVIPKLTGYELFTYISGPACDVNYEPSFSNCNEVVAVYWTVRSYPCLCNDMIPVSERVGERFIAPHDTIQFNLTTKYGLMNYQLEVYVGELLS